MMRIALIGYGEVGTIFGRELRAAGRCAVSAYDIKFDSALPAADGTVALCRSAAEAARDAAIVISAVTAASAAAAATEASRYLRPGQVFLDLNSVSPDTKRHNAAAVAPTGASYVEAAVMASVPPFGLKVPMLLAGESAARLADTLTALGMKVEVVSDRIGAASAIKMCRSIMIKGLEALTIESLLAARHFGAEDQVIASLSDTFPDTDWNALGGYLIGRAIRHGRRRAAEMREAAVTASEAGVKPLMALATAEREDWMADLAEAMPSIRDGNDWRRTLDLILTRLQSAEAPEGTGRGRAAAS